MYKSNVKINYHGFHPSEQARLFVESIIHEIQHELPQGARVKATFSRKDEVIKGVLQVGSYAGPFFSVAASSSLRDVTVKLLEQIRRRLDKWKDKKHGRASRQLSGLKDFMRLDFFKDDFGKDAI